MRCLLLLLPLAFAMAAPAAAQEDGDEGQTICVTVAYRWAGTGEDVRRIRELPVPENFRRPFEGGGCTRFSLVEADLIRWHLAYGDETTTRAALAYLAADPNFADAPPPATYGRELTRAWSAGERATREWLARDPRVAERDVDPRIGRLRALIAAHDHYLFLAKQYLRAAEAYRSPALLAEARTYFAAVAAGTRLIHGEAVPARDPDLELRNRLGVRQHNPLEIGDVEVRLAILTARLSRRPADVDAAQALVDRGFSPVLREAASHLDRMDDFCGNGSGDALDDIRAACDAESNFLGRLSYFWRNQAMLDLLMAGDPVHYMERLRAPPSDSSAADYVRRPAEIAAGPPGQGMFGSLDTALAIFNPERHETVIPGSNWLSAYEEPIALHLAQAEMYERAADADPAGREEFLRGALGKYAEIARLAPAFDNPARFRLAATRFLALLPVYEAATQREGEERRQPDLGFSRQAAWFRALLPAVDRIAVGAAD